MVAGGGPLNATTADFFDEIGFCAVQGYGMSENAPLIATNTMIYKNNKAAGLSVPYTKIRIADPDSEGSGEIQVTSPSLMLGYWNDPEATAEAFTPDHWLRTGDLGYIDSDGYVFITGRSKSLIVTSGGKKISPEEIEARFDGSRTVKEVLVMGRKAAASDNAESVIAVCVPDYETLEAERGLKPEKGEEIEKLIRDEIAALNRDFPPYKKISDVVVRPEEFEKTSSKKIKRFLYAEEYGKAK